MFQPHGKVHILQHRGGNEEQGKKSRIIALTDTELKYFVIESWLRSSL